MASIVGLYSCPDSQHTCENMTDAAGFMVGPGKLRFKAGFDSDKRTLSGGC